MNGLAWIVIAVILIVLIFYLLKDKGESSNDHDSYSTFDPLLGIYRDDWESHQEIMQDTKHQPQYVDQTEKVKKGSRP